MNKAFSTPIVVISHKQSVVIATNDNIQSDLIVLIVWKKRYCLDCNGSIIFDIMFCG